MTTALPHHRSRLFWCGVLVWVYFLFAWWDSSRNSTSLTYLWGPLSHREGFGIWSENGILGVSIGGSFGGVPSNGLICNRTPFNRSFAGKTAAPISFYLFPDHLILKVAYWVIVGLWLIVGSSIFAWWRFRYLRQICSDPSQHVKHRSQLLAEVYKKFRDGGSHEEAAAHIARIGVLLPLPWKPTQAIDLMAVQTLRKDLGLESDLDQQKPANP